PVLIEPFGNGMLVTTLRYDRTVRRPETVFADITEKDVDEEMIELAVDLLEEKKQDFDPSTLEDHYQEALHKFVEARKAGRKPPKAKTATGARPSNVVNLFDALKKSLAAEKPASGSKPRGETRKPSTTAEKSRSKSPAAK